MNLSNEMTSDRGRVPVQLITGLALIVVAWPLNWLLPGPRTHLLFFPLWLGYALAVDGVVFLRKGTSLLTRNSRAYIGLFLISAPAWWLFELYNLRTQNWEYIGRELFSDLEYAVLASLSFSTVLPAVFGMAELVSTSRWLRKLGKGPRLVPNGIVTTLFFVTGWIMLGLMLIWPRVFYPFIWLSAYFILAPINVWMGFRSLGHQTAGGDWRGVLALMLGTFATGFFWEMWNIFAFPKWIYHTPGVEFLYIFEMPFLGYFGYMPFGLELFALYHLVIGLLHPSLSTYIQITPVESVDAPSNQ